MNVETVQHHNLPLPRSDKALVYFYREGRFEGGGTGYHIFEDGRELGSMSNGSFFYVYATPGEHVYELHVPLAMPIQRRVALAAGNTYYLQGGFYAGAISANLTFSVMNEQEGAAALDHLKMRDALKPQ